jgi:hypothetical protein
MASSGIFFVGRAERGKSRGRLSFSGSGCEERGDPSLVMEGIFTDIEAFQLGGESSSGRQRHLMSRTGLDQRNYENAIFGYCFRV